MGKPLKVLIVEDRKEDEELLLRELQKAGYDPLSKRVENSREMSMALDKQEWDMVFSDYVMPAFSGLDAVKLLRGEGFAETPFVIVSGSIGEELAVEALKSGVNDYILKDNFLRLAKIVERELEWAQAKKQLRGFQEAIFARAKEAELMKTQKELADIKRFSDIGQLAATVAHELRNPLGVIKTAVYNLRKKAADPALSKHFDNIDTKIAESDLIIQNLLDYSRIKMPQYEKVAVNDILKSCIKNLRVKYAKWDVKIEIKLPPGGNIIIEGDSLHLSELFTNILDNSYQAFPDKKGRIELEAEYNPEENRLDMKFEDNGIGIEDKDIEKVFEPFYTNKPRGVGLGLAVCKQLVLFHGGTLVLSSKKGAGTTVFLSLPVRRA